MIKYRNYISNTYAVDYEMITIILDNHVINTNNIILGKREVLSCPWFWLSEPQLQVISNIENMSYDDIIKRILNYRTSKLSDVKEMESHAIYICLVVVETMLNSF